MFIQKVSSQQLNRTYSVAPGYPNNDKVGLYILAIPCIISNQLSLAGCLYVLFGTFCRWKIAPTGMLPMSLRIPFYVAITDLLLYTMNFTNILFTFIFHQPWPDPICGIIGAATNFFMNLNMTLFLMLSIVIYVRVCRNKYCSLGSYDWKLLAAVLILSVILAFGDYGEDTWWCASSHKILSEDMEDNNRKRLAEINYKFGLKVITYIFIFVIQWFFSFPYHITRFTGDRNLWSFLLFGVSVNSGGILNGIQYHLKEGWPVKQNNSNNSTQSTMQQKILGITTV
ncbi:hypothetical protein C1645_827587 [Glomus cerebriforme]|uniref:G-protein coupled receptors family 1 profile domain-containing protein n=1 Tax=Glomus cerebriforme TaxID=658196 RepID=A0A397SNL9_9GLOM|nr:hypothetical protein C1645_827587 [Glomus cerebriforme]